MDSKSIARKGVPVRLRDPVLDPDETLSFVGVFLSTFGRVEKRGRRETAKTTRQGLGDAVVMFKTVVSLR